MSNKRASVCVCKGEKKRGRESACMCKDEIKKILLFNIYFVYFENFIK